MIKGFIYKITSPSDKIYIGQTVDVVRRKRKYETLKCEQQPKIYNSIKKYGWDLHLFEIIEERFFDNKKEMNEREMFWITEFNSLNEGLNCTGGGDSKEISYETIEKIRLSKIGKTSPNKGKKMSEEQKQKISLAMKGNKNNRYFSKTN